MVTFNSTPMAASIISPARAFSAPMSSAYTLSDGQNSDTARVRLIVLDRRGPEQRFDAPRDGAIVKTVNAIRGRVRDRESGVKSMSLLWRRLSDKAFWNGSAWTSSATPLPLTVEGTFWKYDGDLPASGTIVKAICSMANTRCARPQSITSAIPVA